MRVIITGGTGFVGSALAKSLVSDGHEVISLSRNPDKPHKLPSEVKILHWDARTGAGWGHLIDQNTAIVNLAGELIGGRNLWELVVKRWTPDRKKVILESRLNAGKAVVQAIQSAENKPKVLIQASAVGFYGDRGDEKLTEDSSPGKGFVSEVVQQWEAATAAVEGMGVRRAIIRSPGIFLSLDGGAFPFLVIPFKLFTGGPIGDGKQYFSWVHLEDEIRAIRFLIDNPEVSGPFNLAAPGATTNAQFNKTLGKVLNRPYWLPLPAFFFKLGFGQQSEIILSSQRQIPKRLLELGFEYNFPEVETALGDLFHK
ncbi:MAG TPA: TIGR01777 family oxidoreductase [Anaerolineales bacterium]|nr:TIGR01777 family oxidoreductase [Anaerolineales bacterium]